MSVKVHLDYSSSKNTKSCLEEDLNEDEVSQIVVGLLHSYQLAFRNVTLYIVNYDDFENFSFAQLKESLRQADYFYKIYEITYNLLTKFDYAPNYVFQKQFEEINYSFYEFKKNVEKYCLGVKNDKKD